MKESGWSSKVGCSGPLRGEGDAKHRPGGSAGKSLQDGLKKPADAVE